MADPARKLTNDERQRLVDHGYHPIEVWLPDMSSAEYRAEADRQAKAAAAADVEDRVMDWVEGVSEHVWDDL
jgi:hypothetical protein